MRRLLGWLAVLMPLLYRGYHPTSLYLRETVGPGGSQFSLGPGGPQFSYGVDYCQWLLELKHDPANPYDDLGGEA